MSTPILRAAARVLSALMLAVSMFLLLRGHDAPGGGFIGGLVAAGAFALVALAHGPAAVRRALPAPPEAVAAAGVATALLAGAIPLALGLPPFAAVWAEGLKPLSTVLLFDVGVWLVVLGGALSLILALEEREEEG